MRCSECFGEMEHKPEGLVCKSCGFSVQVLSEDGEVVQEVEVQARRRFPVMWIAAGLISALLLGGAGYWLWLHPEAVRVDTYIADTPPPAATSAVSQDDQNLIAYDARTLDDGGQASVLGETSCLRLSEPPAQTPTAIDWLDRSGAISASLSPQLPANWRLMAACRSTSGRVVSIAKSTDGVVLSGHGLDGAILWTRLLPGDPDGADLTLLSEVSDQALLLSQLEPTVFELRAFDREGQELWRRSILNVAPGTRPTQTTNSVGDFILAWNEASESGDPVLRVLALSRQNTVNFNEAYSERTVRVASLASDELANTFVLEGAMGFSVQKLRADGTQDWRRWVDASARPIGVIADASGLIVAAHQDRSLIFWRLTGGGERSAPITVELDEAVSGARFDALDEDRARLTLTTATGAQRQVLINLVRLREAAELSASDPVTEFESLAPPQEVEAPARSESELSEVRGSDAPVEDIEIAIVDPIEAAPEPDAPPVAGAAAEADPVLPVLDDAPITDPVPSSESVETVTPAAPDPLTVSEDAASTVIPDDVTRPADPGSSEVECTFFCAAIDNIEATYPMTQPIAIGEDEPLESLETRLEQVHAQICSDSGGQLIVESLPNCTAQ